MLRQGDHHGNLKRHIEKCHSELHDQIEAEIEEVEIKKAKMNNNQKQQSTLDHFLPTSNVTVRTSLNQILLACLKLITIHGRPFSSICDEAIQDLINPMLKGVSALKKDCPSKITINRIKKFMRQKAKALRAKIIKECENKKICVKADIATCRGQSSMGITIQFREDMDFKFYTIACERLRARHNAETIKKKYNSESFKIQDTFGKCVFYNVR